MLTTEIWGFAYPDIGDPTFSMSPCSIPAGAPYLFDQSSQKETISPGIPSFTTQTSKFLKACIIIFSFWLEVLIRNLIRHSRRTMFPYGLFSYVARPPTQLVDRSSYNEWLVLVFVDFSRNLWSMFKTWFVLHKRPHWRNLLDQVLKQACIEVAVGMFALEQVFNQAYLEVTVRPSI